MIETYLQDGFHEVFQFTGHSTIKKIKGFLGMSEHIYHHHVEHQHRHHHHHHHRQQYNPKEDHISQYVSWDSKCLMLWQYDSQSRKQPKILNQLKYSNQPNLISTIVYVDKMKVFLAAALDMTFRIFDSGLNLLEIIHHEERAILDLQYDNEKGYIIASSTVGISVWKIHRSHNLSYSHSIEKLFKFDNINFWVSKMVYDRHFHRVYAISERSVHILSFRKRGVISKLEDIHDAPVTAVCWYGRSQFYITGCGQGLIKCWTSHYVEKKSRQKSPPKYSDNLISKDQVEPDDVDVAQAYVLLFTFITHNKAITSLCLHSVPGLAISTSLDGFLKVLNLEAFTVLFSFNVNDPIFDLKLMPFGKKNESGCLFYTQNGPLRFWKITSYCHFYGMSVSIIHSMDIVDNLQLEALKENGVENTEIVDESIVVSDDLQSDPMFAKDNKEELDDFSYDSLTDDSGDESVSTASSGSGYTGTEVSGELKEDDSDDNDSNDDEDDPGNNQENERAKMFKKKNRKKNKKKTGDTKAEHLAIEQNKKVTEAKEEKRKMHEKYLLVTSFQDLRVFSEQGGLLSCLEPEQVVDNVISTCVSAYQDLLFAMYDSNDVKIFCLRSSYSKYLGNLPIEIVDREKLTCMTLINIRPSGATSVASIDRIRDQLSVRGEVIPGFIQEFVVVGTSNGVIYCFDALSNFSMSYSIAINNGSIKDVKYRRQRKELLVYCYDQSGINATIKVLKLPDMIITHEVNGIRNVSCFNISPSFSFFAIGCTDGNLRLFTLLDTIEVTELLKQTSTHDRKVINLSFCDDLRIFATCSKDATVKIWTYEKDLLRSIKFSNFSSSALFLDHTGDILISQNAYMLVVGRSDWDEGGALKLAKEYRDPWIVDEWSNDMNNNDKKTIQISNKIDDKVSKEPLPGITFLTETLANNKPHTPAITFNITNQLHTYNSETNKTNTSINVDFRQLLQRGTPINTSRPRFRIERKQSLKVEIDGIPNNNDKKNEHEEVHYNSISQRVASLGLSPRASAVLVNPTPITDTKNTFTHRAMAPSSQVPSSLLRNKVSSSYIMNRKNRYDNMILSGNITNKNDEMKKVLLKLRNDISQRAAIINADD